MRVSNASSYRRPNPEPARERCFSGNHRSDPHALLTIKYSDPLKRCSFSRVDKTVRPPTLFYKNMQTLSQAL